jgi:capsular exopolysaccharide synthesis family protein
MQDSNHLNHQPPATGSQFLIKWHRYKKLLLGYWWIVVVMLALSAGGEYLWLKHQPQTFVSEGQMIVNVKLSIPSETTYSEELDTFFGTQVALMQSDTVLYRVARDLQFTNWHDPLQRVRIQVGIVPKTSIFSLVATGRDSKNTQNYLDATMKEYINLKKDLFANASDAARSDIIANLSQLGVKLQVSKQTLIDFQASNSVVLLQQNEMSGAATYLSTLSSELAEHQSELQLLKTLTLDQNIEREQGLFSQSSPSMNDLLHNSGTTLPPPSSPATPDTGAIKSSLNAVSPSLGDFEEGYYQSKAKLVFLKANRDQVSKLYPLAQELVKDDQDIANEERLLEIYKEDSEDQLQNQKTALEVQITNLENQIAVWQPKALDASRKLVDFEALKENNARLQASFDQLQANLQALDMGKGTGQETVTILQPATPSYPLPPLRTKHMAIAGILGLVAGLGILMLKDRLDDRPSSVHELEPLFDESVLGQIPRTKITSRKIGVPLLQLDDNRHTLVEAYHNLRSALVYQDTPANHPRRIVITSASSNEGKSTVAANFAITLAQSGARVLLVDADLRRGKLHKHFEVAATPGVAEVMSQQCEWSKAVVPTAVPNLFLLPAGTCPRRPGSLFAMRAEQFLADTAGQYDYTIFDTPPILAADDVSSLAPHADGLIMVIRAGFTSSRLAKSALDLLYLRHINVIGLVLNAVPKGRGHYFYYGDTNYYPKEVKV